MLKIAGKDNNAPLIIGTIIPDTPPPVLTMPHLLPPGSVEQSPRHQQYGTDADSQTTAIVINAMVTMASSVYTANTTMDDVR